MISLHDRKALAEHCAVHRFDPASGARIARAVLRHGRSLEEALDASRQPVPVEWARGLAGGALKLLERHESGADGATKLVLETPGGDRLEGVLLRIASGRNSLCLSIQSRCPVACRFCASGFLGKGPALGLDEVLDQVVLARRILREEGRELRNLVFMGMGEPLLEEGLLHEAVARLTDPGTFAFPARRIVVSTVGLPAAMIRLQQRFPGLHQALSLHSARQEVRESLIPMARRHSLEELRSAVQSVAEISGGRVLVEYLLLEGVTDQEPDELALAAWLKGLPVLLNLLPYNRPQLLGPGSSVDPALRPTPRPQREALARRFRGRGIPTTLRHSLGHDIAAACGQLAASGQRLDAPT